MGHPHTIKQRFTDNTTAARIDNDTIKQHQSHATNVRYFWISDQKPSRDFLIEWKSGQENIAKYFTKHHYVRHHKRVRPIYIQTYKTTWTIPLVLLKPDLQGCVDPEDSNMEELRKTSPILRILRLRGSKTRTKDRRTTERRKG